MAALLEGPEWTDSKEGAERTQEILSKQGITYSLLVKRWNDEPDTVSPWDVSFQWYNWKFLCHDEFFAIDLESNITVTCVI